MAMRSWNVIGDLPDGVGACSGGATASAFVAILALKAASDAGNDFVRRRIRAVTGSSAVECFCRMRCGVASMVWAALSTLIISASSEVLGPSSLLG